MEKQYIIALVWSAGFLLSYWMLKVEHEAESDKYTNGEKVVCVLLSILSMGMVLYMLIAAWSNSVKKYWHKPAKHKKAE